MWLAVPAILLGILIGSRLWPRTVYAGMSDEDRATLDNALESASDQTLRVRERERQIAVMTVARDPAHMHVLALNAADEIEDIFVLRARSANDRRVEIAAIVRRQVDDALKGGKPEFI